MIVFSSVKNTAVNLDTATFVPVAASGATQVEFFSKKQHYFGTMWDYGTMTRPIRLTACIHIMQATPGDSFELTAHILQLGNNIISLEPKTITVSDNGVAAVTFEVTVSPAFCMYGFLKVAISRVSGTGSTSCDVVALVVDETVTDINGRVDVGSIIGETPLSENTIAQTVAEEFKSQGIGTNVMVKPKEV